MVAEGRPARRHQGREGPCWRTLVSSFENQGCQVYLFVYYCARFTNCCVSRAAAPADYRGELSRPAKEIDEEDGGEAEEDDEEADEDEEEEEEEGGGVVGKGLSEYEQLRLDRIAANTEFLASLGLDQVQPLIARPALGLCTDPNSLRD